MNTQKKFLLAAHNIIYGATNDIQESLNKDMTNEKSNNEELSDENADNKSSEKDNEENKINEGKDLGNEEENK